MPNFSYKNLRVGQGYDLHTLVKGRKLIMGGVEIPYIKGLNGHSDADVLTHAIIDSLVGALGKPDIGQLFPDTSPAFKNKDSIELLNTVYQQFIVQKAEIINIDCTIICQTPKLASFIEPMKKKISETLHIEMLQINIKAKTNEHQDSVGQGQSISVHANCLLFLEHLD